MTDRGLKRLAVSVGAVNLSMAVVASVLLASIITRSIPPAAAWGFPGTGLLYSVSLSFVGWLISTRMPRNPIGWLFNGAAICASVLALSEGYSLVHLARKGTALPAAGLVDWISSGIWVPLLGFISFVLLLFPSGHLPSPRWRIVAWILPPSILFAYMVESFTPGVLDSGTLLVENPYGWELFDLPEAVKEMAPLPMVICLFAAGVGIIIRMRRSQPEEGAQLKWLAYSGTFVGASLFAYGTLSSIQGLEDPLETINALSIISIPTAAAIAIAKYRLYDIDVLINRTLVYAVLTAALGLSYFGIVLLIGQLIKPITSESDIAVAGAAIGVFVLFRPIRERVQSFIDRRFYRAKYDSAKALEALDITLRSEVSRGALTEHVATTARDTLQIASALLVQIDPADPIAPVLQSSGAPIPVSTDIDSPAMDGFRAGGAKLIVPLVTHGELGGALVVGPRLSGQEYSIDDRRFLDRLAALAAPVFRVAQLLEEQERDARAKERVEQELRVATLIQQQFLPTEVPDRSGLHIAAYYKPAREVGGDFYDFIELSGGRLMIVAGDVTDKGVPAALVMATTMCVLRLEAERAGSPAALLSVANEILCRDTPEAMFVTCLAFVIDPKTGEVVFANAGHNLPYVSRGDEVIELRATGMPLGLLPMSRYDNAFATLEPDDRILLCSDGLVEAHNGERELFGFERTKSSLGSVEGDSPEAVIDHMLTDLERFTADPHEQEDDITMVALHYSASVARAFETSAQHIQVGSPS